MTTNNANVTQMDIINEKLMDAEIPGFYALFTDEEAAMIRAFADTAINHESDLVASYYKPDLFDLSTGSAE